MALKSAIVDNIHNGKIKNRKDYTTADIEQFN
jgi:hypothetical protein